LLADLACCCIAGWYHLTNTPTRSAAAICIYDDDERDRDAALLTLRSLEMNRQISCS
jgi:hypothetical protein